MSILSVFGALTGAPLDAEPAPPPAATWESRFDLYADILISKNPVACKANNGDLVRIANRRIQANSADKDRWGSATSEANQWLPRCPLRSGRRNVGVARALEYRLRPDHEGGGLRMAPLGMRLKTGLQSFECEAA